MSGFSAVGFFLVSLLFNTVIFSLWLCIALRYFYVSTLHPLHQLLARFTDPFINPLRTFFKIPYRANVRYDWLIIAVLIATELLKMILLSMLLFHQVFPVSLLILYIVADLIIQPCTILFYALLIRVAMSFINPTWQHPINDIVRLLTEPLLLFARRLIPNIAGFDCSPFLVIILLKIITLFITASLPWNLL